MALIERIGKSRRNRESSSNENCKLYLRQDFIRERLIDANIIAPLVSLPHRVDYNEWLASNTLSFFEHVNSMSGCLVEFCHPSVAGGCLAMTGPGNVQYLWLDERGKKCKCSAPQYIDYAMSFAQKCVSDESIFPTKYGNNFPRSFEKFVRKIHRLLLHVLAHIYQCHCREMAALGLLSHLNTVAFHFLLFNRRFHLLENKETNVLGDLFELLRSNQRREDIRLNLQNFSVLRDFDISASTSSASLLDRSGVKQYQDIRPLTARESDSSAFIRDNMATCG